MIREDIQGLRALAILAVIAFHLNLNLPFGYLGVDIFFVISGYVITQSIARQVFNDGYFKPLLFMKKRAIRLLPALSIMLILITLISFFIDTPNNSFTDTNEAALASLLFFANLFFMNKSTDYFNDNSSNPLLHMWSLSTEEQFYLIITVTLALLFRFFQGTKHQVIYILTLVGILLSFVTTVLIHLYIVRISNYDTSLFVFFAPITRIWEFGCGIAVALITNAITVTYRSLRFLTPFYYSLFLGLLWTFFRQPFEVGSPLAPILPVVLTSLLIFQGNSKIRVVRKDFLSNKLLVKIGNRSYSLYLWQGPLITLTFTLFGNSQVISIFVLILIFVISEISYKLVEIRISFKNIQSSNLVKSQRTPIYIGLSSFVLILANLNVSPGVLKEYWAQKPIRATSLDLECDRQSGDGTFIPCWYGNRSDPLILLVGDSHSGALSEVIKEVAVKNSFQLAVATASACPLIAHEFVYRYRSDCVTYLENIKKFTSIYTPTLVIFSNFSRFYIDDLGVGLETWTTGILEFIYSMNLTTNSEIIWLGDVASFDYVPGRLIWMHDRRFLNAKNSSRQNVINTAERESIESNSFVKYIDLNRFICNHLCKVVVNNNWAYTDKDHLSIDGASQFFPLLNIEINKLMKN